MALNLNITQRILAVFGLLIPVAMLFLWLLVGVIEEFKENEAWVVHTHEVLRQSNVLIAHLADAETGQRGYLLTQKESYLEPYLKGSQAVQQDMMRLTEMTSDNLGQQQRLQQMNQVIRNKFDEMSRTIELMKAGQAQDALNVVLSDQGKVMMDQIRVLVSQFNQAEQILLEQRSTLFVQINATAMDTIQWGALLSVLLTIGLGMLLARNISLALKKVTSGLEGLANGGGDLSLRMEVRGTDEISQLSSSMNRMMEMLSGMISNVRQSSVQVAGTSNQIAASMREQEATVSQQAATTHEIAASSKEIAATAAMLKHNMQGVVTLANNAADSAGQGQEQIELLEHALSSMQAASGNISAKLGHLSEKAANISQVASTISKVADQTNMLSLNASIEAEKAGEYGRGFSVVAQEIRHLADQTAAASIDIENIIRDMQASVSKGVMGMDQFSEEIRAGVETGTLVSRQLVQVIGQVQDLAPVVNAANESLSDQASGAEGISVSISELQNTAQQTAEMVRRTGHAVEDLNTAAADLQMLLAEFKIRSDASNVGRGM
ncbi:MAG: methyl-accepting chemotaxis protein [Mariprofundus sp.]|nr:methyl-accepting chemotaxis protein [Mariprofundus sp.]